MVLSYCSLKDTRFYQKGGLVMARVKNVAAKLRTNQSLNGLGHGDFVDTTNGQTVMLDGNPWCGRHPDELIKGVYVPGRCTCEPFNPNMALVVVYDPSKGTQKTTYIESDYTP